MMLRKVSSVLLILVFTYAGLEIASFAYWSMVWGKIGPASSYYKAETGLQHDGCPWSSMVSTHPYLALRYHRYGTCKKTTANVRGMVGDELPFTRNSDYYNILLLGGSVAEILYDSGALEKKLNSDFLSPTGKPFKLWNSAMSAGMQPRNAIANMMFGEIADAVISVEGFNEHFFYNDLIPLESPTYVWHELEGMMKNARDFNYVFSEQLKITSASVGRNSILRHSYFLSALSALGRQLIQRTGERPSEEIVPYYEGDKAEMQRKFIKDYTKYLTAMEVLAKSRNQKLVVFIQPVPAIQKPLTEADKRAVQNLSYGDSYLSMVKALQGSVPSGMHLLPILDTFANYKDDLYVDLIHFLPESQGNEWLARRIASELSPILKLKRVTKN